MNHDTARSALLAGLLIDTAELRGVLDDDPAASAARFRDVPWHDVIALAEPFAVLPTLAWNLERHGLLACAPPDVQRALVAARVQCALQNHVLLDDLRTVFEILHEARVRALPMKGAALLAGGHVSPAARHLDDIDLWLAPEDTRAAREALLAHGFARKRRPRLAHDGAELAEIIASHHLPGLWSPSGTLVELHVAGHGCDEGFEHAWRTAVVVDGVRVPTPSRLLDEVCAHVVEHHDDEVRPWPRHIVDVARLVARGAVPSTRKATVISLRVLETVRAQARHLGPPLREHEKPHAQRVTVRAHREARRFVLPAPRALPLRVVDTVLASGLHPRALLPARAYLEHAGYLREGEPLWQGQMRRARAILSRI